MRILVLTHRVPFPPDKGDKIRSFNILKFLAARHEVCLASLIDDQSDLKFVPTLERQFSEFLFERIDRTPKSLCALRSVAHSRSITVDYFYSEALQRKVDALIDRRQIDAVFCSCSPMAEYVFRSRHAEGCLRHTRWVMDLIDVDSAKWRQYAERSSSLSAWIYRHEAYHLARYEERIARAFDRLLVVTPQEMTYFPTGGPPANLSSMSNGVDLEFFSPPPGGRAPLVTDKLVFTGSMNYWPNVDGISWFVDRILPRVHAHLPDVRLFVVGNRPVRAVRRLENRRGVTVTGFVEDVREHLSSASVCVAPLRIARGIQNKVLEAMAMGRAVVSTPQALEGIQARPGDEIVVASGEETFAGEVVRLLRNPVEAERVGRNARRCVEQRYTWERNLSLLDEIWNREPATSPSEHLRARTVVTPVGQIDWCRGQHSTVCANAGRN